MTYKVRSLAEIAADAPFSGVRYNFRHYGGRTEIMDTHEDKVLASDVPMTMGVGDLDSNARFIAAALNAYTREADHCGTCSCGRKQE